MTEPTGRRERKKAQTRKALADAALELFLERGYDQVGVKEVADAADVSVTTLFKHFPCKEALVFDLEQDIEAALVGAVRDRAPGRSVLEALREHLLTAVGPHLLWPGAAEKSGLGEFSREHLLTAVGPHTLPPGVGEGSRLEEFSRMVENTPALREYAHRMWLRHEAALGRAIAAETGAPEDDATCAALARFALDIPFLAGSHPDPAAAADAMFTLLERGWNATHPGH
ncbi:TetR family transcriptional regulator [Streptomyces mashuensis]|uniref:TetR family transcriptional regulator n=1 Tax=Streptomyces mashuensis TaxID=33904 RepID=A0A919B4J9_9ACTN|nr:TetR/AcrR family transcriptional regulator [Streptomyces mashuensis]GHF55443.1 TetR family transcriptional regulator [Streptomyces mashuensis]